jgi:Protein of unknown function (DUF2797)
MLVGAVAFSNLPRNYGLPAYFVGILVDAGNLTSLEKIHTKEFFQPDRNHLTDPFNLAPLTNEVLEISGLIKKTIWVDLPGLSNKPKNVTREEFLSTFQSIIDQLESGDLEVLASGIKEIRIHNPFETEVKPEIIDLTGFMKLGDEKTITEKRGNFSPVTQLARLVAWHRYITSRRKVPEFVRTYMKSSQQAGLKHLVRLGWPKVGVDEYANSFLGFPEVIVRNGGTPSETILSPEATVSLFPVAKCCIGPIESSNAHVGCLKSGNLPYGEVLSIDESEVRCYVCRSAIDRLKFGLKGARKASNDKKAPVGKYSEDFHYVYVSLFGRRLKVGRARLSRGVTRIMEQGAADALVFYPLTSFEQADEFESELVQQLKAHKAELAAFNVEQAGDRAYVGDKIELLRQHYDIGFDDRNDLYKEVLRIINLSESLEMKSKVLQTRVLSFLDNWRLPENSGFLRATELPAYWQRIEGKIEGSVGSMIVVSGQLVDLEKLQGSVFRGEGFEPSRTGN